MKGFKTESDSQREQVLSYYYKNRNEFLIRILTHKKDEGIYLLKTDSESATFDQVIQQVIDWEK